MSEQVKVAVVYYSSTGTVYELAKSIVEGAEKAGAEVRLRKVHELAPDEAIAAEAGWASHAAEAQYVAEATAEDILWADAVIFGSPPGTGTRWHILTDPGSNEFCASAAQQQTATLGVTLGTRHGRASCSVRRDVGGDAVGIVEVCRLLIRLVPAGRDARAVLVPAMLPGLMGSRSTSGSGLDGDLRRLRACRGSFCLRHGGSHPRRVRQ